MLPVHHVSYKVILFLLLPVMFSACADFQSNVGRTVADEHALPAVETASASGIWETSDLKVLYSVEPSGDSYSIAGEVRIDDYITKSFPLVVNFRLFINYLDEHDTVISTHDISPMIGFRKYIPESLELRDVPPAPAESASFSFSYRGTFADDDTPKKGTGTWTIHFFPFQENR